MSEASNASLSYCSTKYSDQLVPTPQIHLKPSFSVQSNLLCLLAEVSSAHRPHPSQDQPSLQPTISKTLATQKQINVQRSKRRGHY